MLLRRPLVVAACCGITSVELRWQIPCAQVLGLLSTLMLRNPEAAAAAAEAGCLEAVLEVMAVDEAPAPDDPRNAAQWVQRQVTSSGMATSNPTLCSALLAIAGAVASNRHACGCAWEAVSGPEHTTWIIWKRGQVAVFVTATKHEPSSHRQVGSCAERSHRLERHLAVSIKSYSASQAYTPSVSWLQYDDWFAMSMQACMALRNAVARSTDLRGPLLAAGAEPLLRAAQRRHPAACADVGAAALRDLGLEDYLLKG